MKKILTTILIATIAILPFSGWGQNTAQEAKNDINATIVTNGTRGITAAGLNRVLNGMWKFTMDSVWFSNDTLNYRRGGTTFQRKVPGIVLTEDDLQLLVGNRIDTQWRPFPNILRTQYHNGQVVDDTTTNSVLTIINDNLDSIVAIIKAALIKDTTVATYPFRFNKNPSNSRIDSLIGLPFKADSAGLVPAPITVAGKYLKDDGTWDTPAAGGSGNTNSNVGAGYRAAVPGTNNIKTFFNGYAVGIDSASNANGLTLKADTSKLSTLYHANLSIIGIDSISGGGGMQFIHGDGTRDTSLFNGGSIIDSTALSDSLLNYVKNVTKNATGDSFYIWKGSTHTALKDSSGGATPTGAALTKTDDTNVTLALGGTPTTALLQATSLTLGWTGNLAATRGGTGTATVTTGDLLYGSATNTWSKLPIGTTGQHLQIVGGLPVWRDTTAGGGGGQADSAYFWNKKGNTLGTGYAFLGTINNRSLRFRINNTELMRLDSAIGAVVLTIGTNSISITGGLGSGTSTDRAIVIGQGSATGVASTSIGGGAASNTGNIAIGYNSTSSGGIAISSGGNNATVSGGGLALGGNSSSVGGGAALGASCTIGSDAYLAAGAGAAASGSNSIALGSANVSGAYSIGIGRTATVAYTSSIAMGMHAYASGAGQFVAASAYNGTTTYSINEVYFGSGPQGNLSNTMAGSSYGIYGSGGFGSNQAGGNITIGSGKGTGTGTGGDIIFSTPVTGTTGSTLQSLQERARFTQAGGLTLQSTVTAGGTTGAQTINKPSGSVNFAAAATTLVVTNSLATTSSQVFVQVYGTDATATSARVTLASGSFTITLNAAATAETKVGFFVIN